MAKRKKKPRDMTPHQFPADELWYISMAVWKLKEYRESRWDTSTKIKARLFYQGDDIPDSVWCLPVPGDLDTLFSWNEQLVGQTHNARVGAIDTHDEDIEESYHSFIFEDKNDMLLFKLSVKI